MATKDQVINLHRRERHLNASDIAERLGCLPEYVRATARRNNLVLPVRYEACRRAALNRSRQGRQVAR